MADKLFGKETIAGAEKVRNTAAEIQNIFSKIDITQLSKGMQTMAQSSQDMAGELSNSLKYSKENKKIAQQQSKAAILQAKYATTQNKIAKTFRSFQISMLKGQDDFTAGLKESSQEWSNLKQGAKDLANSLAPIDDLFGGIGQSIGSFLTNPLTIATGLLLGFNAQQEAIADQFGAMGVTRFRSELDSASLSFTELGFSASDMNKTTSDLANSFGLSVPEAAELSKSVAETAKGLGMSLDESSKLLGTLTTIGGLTTQQATDLAKQTQSLAEANGVAPDKVLGDIANNTELFAKYAKDGGANVARAAIQARKLGLEIGDVASSMEGMLDFQGSLNDEMEASAILGRQVNLQKARELSLAGDIEGFQTEILKQVGSQAQFDKMNVLQKQALAKATGLTVDKLGKMVSKEKEAATLAGEMNKQKVEDLVSAEALTGMATFMNQIKALGVELSNTLGPTLNMIVGIFGSVVSALNDMKVLMPAVIGFVSILAAQKLIDAAASTKQTLATIMSTKAKIKENIANQGGIVGYVKHTAATLANTASKSAGIIVSYAASAGTMVLTAAKTAENLVTNAGIVAMVTSTATMVANTAVKGASAIASYAASAGAMVLAAANFMAGAAAGTLASFGFGGPLMIAMAIGGIAAMVAGIAKARSAGDMVSPASGKTQISTKEGGLFNMSKNDDILAGPGLAGAMGGGGGTTINLENKQNETNSKLERVASVLENALSGPKPALARAMGSSVGDSVEGMA